MMIQKFFVGILSIILTLLTITYLLYKVLVLKDLASLWGAIVIVILITLGLCIKIFSAKNLLRRDDVPEEIKKEYNDVLVKLIREKNIDSFIVVNFIYNALFWSLMRQAKFIIIVWSILLIYILIYLVTLFRNVE